MYFRKVVMLNLFVSLIMSQEQLGSDIDGEAADDYVHSNHWIHGTGSGDNPSK